MKKKSGCVPTPIIVPNPYLLPIRPPPPPQPVPPTPSTPEPNTGQYVIFGAAAGLFLLVIIAVLLGIKYMRKDKKAADGPKEDTKQQKKEKQEVAKNKEEAE